MGRETVYLKPIRKIKKEFTEVWLQINKYEVDERGRDEEIDVKRRRGEDDVRILWMDFSFPSDSRTSVTSAQMATWETER